MDIYRKTRKGTFVFKVLAMVVFLNPVFVAQDHSPGEKLFSRDEIVSDIRYLMNLLQDVHPDPYSGIGGRVAFQLEAQNILGSIPKEGLTSQDLYLLLRPFFGKIGDGHSYVYNPFPRKSSRETLYLPIRFRIANDSIYVSETQKSYQDLIGFRLSAVNGTSLDELIEATKNLYPSENLYSASRWFVYLLASNRLIGSLLPNVDRQLSLSLLDFSGAEVKRTLSFSSSVEGMRNEKWISRQLDDVVTKSLPFHYQIWVEKDTAYLKVKTVMAREAFEIMRTNNRADLDQRLKSFYRNTLKKPKPQNINQAIDGIPSLTATVSELLADMKKLQVKNLIIDIRSNDGGWSVIASPMLYMLFGDRFFAQEPISFATRISKHYLQLFNLELSALNERDNASFRLGDIRVQASFNEKTPEVRRKQYISEMQKDNLQFLAYIESLNGISLYTPEVYVLTDPGTFSAAYDMMYHLWRNGANVVGVPPAQSANTFVDPSPFELPNTKIVCNISRTAVLYPGVIEIDRAFKLDFPMSWTEFRRYDFDLHSEVLYVLDLIQGRI